MKIVQDAFLRRTEELDRRLGVGRSFDMVGRSLTIGGRRARLWVVNGYADDAVLERAVAGWLAIRDLAGVNTAEAFAARYVTVSDAAAEQDMAASVALMALIWVTSLAIFLATSLAAEAPEAVPVIMDQCVEQTSRPAFV